LQLKELLHRIAEMFGH